MRSGQEIGAGQNPDPSHLIEEPSLIGRVQVGDAWAKYPIISFSDEDYKGMFPHQDDPMVISIVTVEYKIERVLVNQGSFANMLY
ncbi:hypothetical protein CR513_01910, partial [Mucuna pruriens]